MEPLLISTEEYENWIQKISRLTVSQVTILLQLFSKDYIVFLISNKLFLFSSTWQVRQNTTHCYSSTWKKWKPYNQKKKSRNFHTSALIVRSWEGDRGIYVSFIWVHKNENFFQNQF